MKVWRHLRVALWLAGCAAAGAESATNSAPLDLASCVDQALQYNLGLSVRRYGPRQAREDLIIANAAFDARLDAAADASESRASKAASELEGSDQPISRNNSGSLGVNKKISSGATVGLSTDLDRSDTDSEFATLNPSYNAGLGVEFRQPLLKGGGSTVTLAPVRQGEIAVRRADLDLRAAALDLARDTELAYWKLEYAIEDLRVVEIALQIALRLVQETRARQAAGLATPVDVIQAEAAAAARREGIITAQQTVERRGRPPAGLPGSIPRQSRSAGAGPPAADGNWRRADAGNRLGTRAPEPAGIPQSTGGHPIAPA